MNSSYSTYLRARLAARNIAHSCIRGFFSSANLIGPATMLYGGGAMWDKSLNPKRWNLRLLLVGPHYWRRKSRMAWT